MTISLIQESSTNLAQVRSTFLSSNRFNSLQPLSDIEMISLQSVSYTSLKDLLPASPPAITSPTRNSGSHEIPIKNKLVKQAALAYLQPMSSPPSTGDKTLLGRFKDRFCDQCECLAWFHDVVFRALKDVFSEPREDYVCDCDDDDEGKFE